MSGLTCHYCGYEFTKQDLLEARENPRCPGCGTAPDG